MKLMMFLANDLIDSVPICRESVSMPGYIGKMKRELEKKYFSLIRRRNVVPEFLIVKASQEEKPSQDQKNNEP